MVSKSFVFLSDIAKAGSNWTADNSFLILKAHAATREAGVRVREGLAAVDVDALGAPVVSEHDLIDFTRRYRRECSAGRDRELR
jgi:hypothetical protein